RQRGSGRGAVDRSRADATHEVTDGVRAGVAPGEADLQRRARVDREVVRDAGPPVVEVRAAVGGGEVGLVGAALGVHARYRRGRRGPAWQRVALEHQLVGVHLRLAAALRDDVDDLLPGMVLLFLLARACDARVLAARV